MSDAWTSLSLTTGEIAFLALCTLFAGIVRGFSGFALSALVIASAAAVLPPIQLIPMLFFQEMAASLLMARDGWRDADRTQTWLLVAGSWAGLPLGLSLTKTLPTDTSRMVALVAILVLAVMQLARLRIPGLASRLGTALSGFVAGTMSGIANIGGMVVALFALAQDGSARSIRGTLVLYLFVSSAGSLIIQLGLGVMTHIAMLRGLLLIPFTLAGVVIGARLFSQKYEKYYRPFCLGLLIFLAVLGLMRATLG